MENLITDITIGSPGIHLHLDIYFEEGKFLGGRCVRKELEDSYRIIEFNRKLIIDLFTIIIEIGLNEIGKLANKYTVSHLQRTNMGRQIVSSGERDFITELETINCKNIKQLITELLNSQA